MNENYDEIRKFFNEQYVIYYTSVLDSGSTHSYDFPMIVRPVFEISENSKMFVKLGNQEIEIVDFNRVELLSDLEPIELIKLTIELVFMQQNEIEYLKSEIRSCRY